MPLPLDSLPPLHLRREIRRRQAGWLVRDLPAEEIAAELGADYGVTYRNGSGYTRRGERVTADAVALDVAEMLRRLADDTDPAVVDYRLTVLTDEITDAEPADIPALVRERDRLDRLANLPDAEEIAKALRETAADLRGSGRARASLMGNVRNYLPSGAPARTDADAAAWLARFDLDAWLRRSDLTTHYRDAGSPGDVPETVLRALAAARWGSPVKVRGHFGYRPARATAGRLAAARVAVSADHPVTVPVTVSTSPATARTDDRQEAPA
ncbi:hypothetical protein FE374_05135 [Georgenia yuyongxinii]|uniref:Uncharacterized protein n=1 Tax=Georgenia yuyongxinii TaxID=2589797 RepID=A0A5B8C836_9MICO|nr:hypothetical protein [Georgenia yuyongxinii]QDC24096.1 hypothetical protein FE374_05135 [Georgenia yuyongxinii]